MLLQSHANAIDILPALPSAWAKGKILGLKTIGNYEADIERENHQLKKAAIRLYAGKIPAITLMGKPVDVKRDPRISFTIIK